MSDNQDIIDRIIEIRDELIDLIDEVEGLVSDCGDKIIYKRADVHWLAHIRAALGIEGYSGRADVTIDTTIEELQESQDDNDDEEYENE